MAQHPSERGGSSYRRGRAWPFCNTDAKHGSASQFWILIQRSQAAERGYEHTLITTHGTVSLKTSCCTTLAGQANGWQPGSTRSTTILPLRGPKTPGATSTTPEKSVGSQIAPTPFGPYPI